MFFIYTENYKLEHLRVLALLINNIKTCNLKIGVDFQYLTCQTKYKKLQKEDVSGGKSLYGMYQKSIK